MKSINEIIVNQDEELFYRIFSKAEKNNKFNDNMTVVDIYGSEIAVYVYDVKNDPTTEFDRTDRKYYTREFLSILDHYDIELPRLDVLPNINKTHKFRYCTKTILVTYINIKLIFNKPDEALILKMVL